MAVSKKEASHMLKPAAQVEPRRYALALETSGQHGSVAIGRQDECLESRRFSAEMQHATELLPTIDALCRAHGAKPGYLAWVCVSGGPGSFTGLRVGVTCARMLAMGLWLAVVRVPTLEVIAQNALQTRVPPQRVVVLLDAKRKRVFAGQFKRRGDRFVSAGPPVEADPREFCAKQPRPCAVMGEGVSVHRQAVRDSGLVVLPEHLSRPRAEVVFQLGVVRAAAGEVDDPRGLVPIYVRRPEAEEVWERRHGVATGKGDEGHLR